MKNIFLAIAAIILVAGCTKSETAAVGCTVETSASSLLAASVAAQLSCKNLDAVKASISAEVAKSSLCKSSTSTTQPAAQASSDASAGAVQAKAEVSAQSAIGSAICGPLVDGMMLGVLAKVPAEWGCSGGPTADQLKKVLTDSCQKAL